MSDKAANEKQDKVYTLLGGLVVAGLLIWLGFAMFGGKKTETADNVPDSSETTDGADQASDKSSQPAKSANPETDIWRAVMVDTVSEWDDVDEFSLKIDENVPNSYVVSATANYNGISTNTSDALTTYCNKIATAIDLSGASVAELEIVWTIPAESSEPAGKCHYHGQDGVLIYDEGSNGILVNG